MFTPRRYLLAFNKSAKNQDVVSSYFHAYILWSKFGYHTRKITQLHTKPSDFPDRFCRVGKPFSRVFWIMTLWSHKDRTTPRKDLGKAHIVILHIMETHIYQHSTDKAIFYPEFRDYTLGLNPNNGNFYWRQLCTPTVCAQSHTCWFLRSTQAPHISITLNRLID